VCGSNFAELNSFVYSLVPPCVADATVDCTLCRNQINEHYYIITTVTSELIPKSATRLFSDSATGISQNDLATLLVIVGHILCACSKTAICEIQVKTTIPTFDRSTPISL